MKTVKEQEIHSAFMYNPTEYRLKVPLQWRTLVDTTLVKSPNLTSVTMGQIDVFPVSDTLRTQYHLYSVPTKNV